MASNNHRISSRPGGDRLASLLVFGCLGLTCVSILAFGALTYPRARLVAGQWQVSGTGAASTRTAAAASTATQDASIHLTGTARAVVARQTATAKVQATQTARAAATRTAEARRARYASWPVLLEEPFGGYRNGWYFGPVTSELGSQERKLLDNKMVWTVTKSEGFVAWDGPDQTTDLTDFHASIEVRADDDSARAASGLWIGSAENYRLFLAQDDRHFLVQVHTEENGWGTTIGPRFSSAMFDQRPNKLAVAAEDGRLLFFINDQLVLELKDDLPTTRDAGIAIYAAPENTFSAEFDNFAVRVPP